MSALLEVDRVTKRFGMGGILGMTQLTAVNDVSFTLDAEKPEIFTIVGESGSGKTTMARMILTLEVPSEGEIRFRGKRVDPHAPRQERLDFMHQVQPVFQNPFEAFNPLKEVELYLASTARRFLGLNGQADQAEAMDEALQKVGLSYKEIQGRFAHELSGGQLQRVSIARALICNPSLLIADEPVSMVDASLRMSIVNLLRSLRDDLGVNVIYITHDLATAYYISDRIMIMQKGDVVEMGPAQAVLDHPEHPYSRLLKSSVLNIDDAGEGNLTTDRELMDKSREVQERTGSRLEDRSDGRMVRVYS